MEIDWERFNDLPALTLKHIAHDFLNHGVRFNDRSPLWKTPKQHAADFVALLLTVETATK